VAVPVLAAGPIPASGSVSTLAVVGILASAAGVGYAAGRAQLRRAGAAVMQEDDEWVDAVNTPTWEDPREGNPFTESGRPRKNKEAYQPRGIADATVIKRQYIETDDEPWHSTCRPVNPVTKGGFENAIKTSVGFIEAEEKLTTTLSAAKTADAVAKAKEKAIEDGARKGSPAMGVADKCLKAFEKAEKTTAQLSEKLTQLKAEAEAEAKVLAEAEAKAKAEAEAKAAAGADADAETKEDEKTEEKAEATADAEASADAEADKKEEEPEETAADRLKAAEEDIKKAMDAALKTRPKAPKKPGAQGSGWDDMKRGAGATHSTSGFS
jgi:hypothetical protein